MRRSWWVIGALAATVAGTSPCVAADEGRETIVQVLHRSQQMRLDSLQAGGVDSRRAAVVRTSFERLVSLLEVQEPLELRVVRGEIVAETLQGRVLVANESLAALPEGQRLFVLAHEIGHVAHGHWAAMGQLYLKWIPGAVVPQTTDAVAGPLAREASALAHRQEYEADAFALRTLRLLGHSEDEAIAAFIALGARSETATHPATRKRVAAMRGVR